MMFSIIQSAFYCEAFLRIVYVAGLLTTWYKNMRFLKLQIPHLQHKPNACAASV